VAFAENQVAMNPINTVFGKSSSIDLSFVM
jgi:hypothetical protein